MYNELCCDADTHQHNFFSHLQLLEEAFIRNPNAIVTYKTSNGVEAKVDLSTKLGDYGGTQFKLTRDDLSKPKGMLNGFLLFSHSDFTL